MKTKQENRLSRYELQLARMAREYFYKNPNNETEVIAKHYASLAIVAIQLLELIKLREQQFRSGKDADAEYRAIVSLATLIKSAHLRDFGIKLEWHPNLEK